MFLLFSEVQEGVYDLALRRKTVLVTDTDLLSQQQTGFYDLIVLLTG